MLEAAGLAPTRSTREAHSKAKVQLQSRRLLHQARPVRDLSPLEELDPLLVLLVERIVLKGGDGILIGPHFVPLLFGMLGCLVLFVRARFLAESRERKERGC